MHIGIDLDGTVTDPQSCFHYMNDALGYTIDYQRATEYELHTYTTMTQHDFWKFMIEHGHEEEIYRRSLPHTEVSDVLWHMRKTHRLHYVTARSEAVRSVTEDWIKQQALPLDSLIMTGSHDKVGVVQDLSLDLFMEDRYENAISIHEQTEIPVLLFDAPYNRKPLPHGVKRIASWKEALHYVNRFEANRSISTR
ncbi:MAG: hypothetical protein LPJ96_12880 [Exiguobacterium sp.]|uniref:Nucleotidase n=1 Tax=Exiguobacterium alkaliphilum TaxID=1428684 RepID=A0ABT2L1D6_9BACL|nr:MULTISPECIES: hypothetical protein [Exiguobacterium]MCT4796528.1 hypothetical protein [Exiguobacterium alkaliphilum]MDX5324502.1 hypothetical protein [Exiguobacterium sp.]MDX5426346.1 hypothetical protein [Exiguobacterium sp.]MDX6773719.1 hypothetical protein [Exiguobacterium sp.]